MRDQANTDPHPDFSETIPDLRLIYECWELAVTRADDPALPDEQSREAVVVSLDCERLACLHPARTLGDLAIKAVIACGSDERGQCSPILSESLVRDARCILEAPNGDHGIARYFDIWAKIQAVIEQCAIGEEDDMADHMAVVQAEICASASRFAASTAEGLARKIVMAVDLGTRGRDIVESARLDIERFAGHRLMDC